MVYIIIYTVIHVFATMLVIVLHLVYRKRYQRLIDGNGNNNQDWFDKMRKTRIMYYDSARTLVITLIGEGSSFFLLYMAGCFDKII